jgi:hypothetical protein
MKSRRPTGIKDTTGPTGTYLRLSIGTLAGRTFGAENASSVTPAPGVPISDQNRTEILVDGPEIVVRPVGTSQG